MHANAETASSKAIELCWLTETKKHLERINVDKMLLYVSKER